MTTPTPTLRIFANTRPFLEGIWEGVNLVNDSTFEILSIKESDHPCHAYVLTAADHDDDRDDVLKQHINDDTPVTMSASAATLFFAFNRHFPEGTTLKDMVALQNGQKLESVRPASFPQHAVITIASGYLFDGEGNQLGLLTDAARAWLEREKQRANL
jgi:hypothetical protein